MASCQSKKHLQNNLFVLPLPQQYCTIICRWHAAVKFLSTPATLAPAHTPCLFSIDLHTVRQHLVIVLFIFLLLLSGTLFEMISGVPHHCHHLSLVWRHTYFVQFTKTELCLWLLYICIYICVHGLALLYFCWWSFPKNASMCKKIQIN